jgi:hypothetical protein
VHKLNVHAHAFQVETTNADSALLSTQLSTEKVSDSTMNIEDMKSKAFEAEGNDHVKGTAIYEPDESLSISPTAVQRDRSIKAETYVYIVLAVGASLFLGMHMRRNLSAISDHVIVFALLAASVHQTFPGFNFTYKPGHPISGAVQVPSFPDLIILPNATAIALGDLKDNKLEGFGMAKSLPSATALNNRLREAANLGPTIFPILFAGIMGSTLRLVARWRAEKGSSIGVIYLRVLSGIEADLLSRN